MKLALKWDDAARKRITEAQARRVFSVIHEQIHGTRLESDMDRIVAVLHDVLEDTAVTMDDPRREGFPSEMFDALSCVTKTHENEDYQAFVRRAASNPIARRVKLADLEDNMDVRRLTTVTEKDAKRITNYLAPGAS